MKTQILTINRRDLADIDRVISALRDTWDTVTLESVHYSRGEYCFRLRAVDYR